GVRTYPDRPSVRRPASHDRSIPYCHSAAVLFFCALPLPVHPTVQTSHVLLDRLKYACFFRWSCPDRRPLFYLHKNHKMFPAKGTRHHHKRLNLQLQATIRDG